MSVEAVAARYARALFEIGTETNGLAALADEIRKIGEVYAGSAELRSVVDNPLVDEKGRKAVLADLCGRLGLGPIARNTVQMLAERHRLAVLPYVSRELDRFSEEKQGLVRAHVTTATQMPDTYYAKVKEQIEKATGKKVVLDRAVDPALLGGVVTRIGDRVIDGSIRSRLDALKTSLLIP